MVKKVAFALSLILAGLLLVWMLGDGRLAEAFVRLFAIPAGVAATVLATQAFSYYCRARRIAGEFTGYARIPFSQYLRISLLHNFSVNIIPFRGGELMLPYLLRRAGIPGARAVTTLIWLRVQDALVLGGVALLLWPGIALWLRLTASLGLIAGVIVFRLTARRLRAPARAPGLQKWFDALTDALDAPLSSWGWSISNWVAKLAGQSILLRRAGIPGARAVTTLIWLRVQDALVLGGVALLLWPGFALWLRLTASLGLIAGVIVFRLTARRLRAPARAPGLQKWFDALTDALDAPLSSWGWSISNWVAKLAGQSILLTALAATTLSAASLGALGGELSAMLPVQGVGGFGTYEAGVAFGLIGGLGEWTNLLVPAFALHSFTLLFAAVSGILAWIALPDALPVAAPEPTEKT